jgi:hypothetical protein
MDVLAKLSVSPGVGLPLVDGSKWNLNYNWAEVIYPPGWVTIWQRNSEGIIHGFHIDSDTDRLEVRVSVNGVVKFVVDVKTFKDMKFDVGQDAVLYQNRNMFATTGDDFDFSPTSDMYFSQSLKIEVRKNDGSSLKVKAWFVQYSEV